MVWLVVCLGCYGVTAFGGGLLVDCFWVGYSLHFVGLAVVWFAWCLCMFGGGFGGGCVGFTVGF